MEIQELLSQGLAQSSRGKPLLALAELYAQIEADTQAFQAAAKARLGSEGPSFGCPAGCGACCERFIPDVLPLEADLAALYILRVRPELAERKPRDRPPCPFYDADKPEAHCSIYPARPLICRLFGYTAVATKTGRAAYSLCWAMPNPGTLAKRAWEGEELEAALGAVPPFMADYGLRLQGLAPEVPAAKPLLGQAVEASLAKLSLLLSFSAQADTP